jgi:hypothetical protein
MKILGAACLMLAVAGCASSTGVMPFGKDTYTITATSLLPSGAQKSALTQALASCAESGLQMSPVSTQTTAGGDFSSYELVFRCLAEDDPAYTRPDWGSPPDVVIENR